MKTPHTRTGFPLLLIAATLALGVPALAQTVYQYVDDNGTIVFTDRAEDVPRHKVDQTKKRDMQSSPDTRASEKPKNVDLPVTTEQVGAKEEPPPKVARHPNRVPEVTVYVTSWCGYCKKLKAHLQAQGVSYVEKDIEKDAGAGREYNERFKGSGVPVLTIGDDVVVGYNRERVDQLLADY